MNEREQELIDNNPGHPTESRPGVRADDMPPVLVHTSRAERRAQKRARTRLRKKQDKVVKHMANKHDDKMKQLETHATVAEVIQIATSVANDVLNDYHRQSNPIIVGLSLHMELFKKTLIDKGLIDAEEFDKLFEESVAEFNRVREEQLKERRSVQVDDPATGDVPSAEAVTDTPEIGESQDKVEVATE